MKGPSLEAIRRFKEQQELKKRQEDEKKIKQKLSTLEHRASQGDRKAKQELKKFERIEKIEEERRKNPELFKKPVSNQSNRNAKQEANSKPSTSRPKFKKDETDFDELMRLAKQNNNEINRAVPPPTPKRSDRPTLRKFDPIPIIDPISQPSTITTVQPKLKKGDSRPQSSRDLDSDRVSIRRELPIGATSSRVHESRLKLSDDVPKSQKQKEMAMRLAAARYRAQQQVRYLEDCDDENDDYDEDDDDDDLRDFVVDDDEEDARAELNRTLKSVFRYDKRRCDLREAEIDRQYRALNRGGTFEDLEREERRASRLAAAEDARAEKEEEERKRLKKIRLERLHRD